MKIKYDDNSNLSQTMWWDPQHTIDPHFLECVPYLFIKDFTMYPISPKKLKDVTDDAINERNFLAVIGAFDIRFKKNDHDLMYGYETPTIQNFRKLFFLVSEPSMKKKSEYLLYWMTRKIFEKYLKNCPKTHLLNFQIELKSMLYIAEQYGKNSKFCQKTNLVQEIFKSFQNLMKDNKLSNGDEEYFRQEFKTLAQVLSKNKKEEYLFKVIYEMKYCLIQKIKDEEKWLRPLSLIQFIIQELAYLTFPLKLSFSIQHTYFIMKKLLYLQTDIPSAVMEDILVRLQIIIEAYQFNRANIESRMKMITSELTNEHYFQCVQRLFGYKSKRSKTLLKIKEELRNGIEQEASDRSISIDEAILYVQLKNKEQSLFGTDFIEINHFPDLLSIVLTSKDVIDQQFHHFCSKKQLPSKLKEMMEKTKFSDFNIIEKGIYLYYLFFILDINYENYYFQEGQKEKMEILRLDLLSGMNNEELFTIADFYLIKLGLGNFYHSQQPNNKTYSNLVPSSIYNMLIQVFFTRVNKYLDSYKEIQVVKDINHILKCGQWFIILTKALYQTEQHLLICPNCKIIQYYSFCPFCRQVMYGIKLRNEQVDIFLQSNKLNSRDSVTNTKKKISKILKNIKKDMDEHSNMEWLMMLESVLSEVSRILK